MAEMMRVEGLAELGRAIKQLDVAMQKRVARSATAAGARVVRAEARRRAPKDTGRLRKNIVTRNYKPQPGMQETGVGVRVRGKTGESAWYWRLVEFGHTQTRMRVQTADGDWITLKRKLDRPIQHAPRPFLRPALETKRREAAERIRDQALKRIRAEADKLR